MQESGKVRVIILLILMGALCGGSYLYIWQINTMHKDVLKEKEAGMASALKMKDAVLGEALKAKEAELGAALKAKDAELEAALKAKEEEHKAALTAKEADYEEALKEKEDAIEAGSRLLASSQTKLAECETRYVAQGAKYEGIIETLQEQLAKEREARETRPRRTR